MCIDLDDVGEHEMLRFTKAVVAVFLVFAFGLAHIQYAKAQPPDPCFDSADWEP
jgi:preprotein translocase subunit SecG